MVTAIAPGQPVVVSIGGCARRSSLGFGSAVVVGDLRACFVGELL